MCPQAVALRAERKRSRAGRTAKKDFMNEQVRQREHGGRAFLMRPTLDGAPLNGQSPGL
jgi:hypothetical protein